MYQSWKTAQMEEEDRELLQSIQRMVMSEKPMSMFVQLHTSNILLWGVEKVKSELVGSWQNQVRRPALACFNLMLTSTDHSS